MIIRDLKIIYKKFKWVSPQYIAQKVNNINGKLLLSIYNTDQGRRSIRPHPMSCKKDKR